MTQREQYSVQNVIKNALSAYKYTPGKLDDSEMIQRLTEKVFALALEEGEVLSRRESRARAMENLAWARAEIAKVAR